VPWVFPFLFVLRAYPIRDTKPQISFNRLPASAPLSRDFLTGPLPADPPERRFSNQSPSNFGLSRHTRISSVLGSACPRGVPSACGYFGPRLPEGFLSFPFVPLPSYFSYTLFLDYFPFPPLADADTICQDRSGFAPYDHRLFFAPRSFPTLLTCTPLAAHTPFASASSLTLTGVACFH